MRAIHKLAVLLCPPALLAQVTVTTGQYNTGRTNSNLSERNLNTANVNPTHFGFLYARQVDGQLYAQPLYVSGVSIQGKTQNVVFAATMHNSVYAFAADGFFAAAPLWHVNLGPTVPFGYPELQPECGILSTPVIDAASKTLYVVALTLEGGNSVYRLHALDMTSGAEKFGGPVLIQAAVKGTGYDNQNGIVTFSAANQLQRPALLLFAGLVFASFGTASPQELENTYHGWLLGYNATTLQQKFVFNTTPNGGAGGIWMSGAGPAADLHGVYFVTGNGVLGQGNTSEAVIRVGGTANDFFVPDTWQTLNANDWDLGTSSALLIPGTNLLAAGGKTGTVYVLTRTKLGGLTTGNTQAAQVLQATAGCSSAPPLQCNEIHNMAYWSRTLGPPLLYVWGWNEPLKSFAMTNGSFEATPIAQSSGVANYPGGILALSANGSASGSGILWATTSSPDGTSAGILHAFDASNVANELWNSALNARDSLGTLAKFTAPTVANGKVFVATFSNRLAVYGLR